jgi:hypothetical protein
MDVSDAIPNVPAERWVTRIECSPFEANTAYLALDRHRNDDRRPYLFKTTDAGTTWRPIIANLPAEGPVHVVRADPVQKNLLYVGTEFGVFVSLDGGEKWHQLRGGLPTVAVHDLAVHPRDHELVIGTHGRGIFVLDIAPLQELTRDTLSSAVHLFNVKPAARFVHRGVRWPSRAYVAPNPPFGVSILYYLGREAKGPVRIAILDSADNTMAELPGASGSGLQLVQWDMRRGKDDGEDPELVPAGEYRVRLQIGEKSLVRKFQIRAEE